MKKLKRLIIILFILFAVCNCAKKENYVTDKEVTLKGKITTSQIIKDNETFNINILELDEPIIIDGEEIKKIEISHDKELKDNTEVSIIGKITTDGKKYLSEEYIFDVKDITDPTSYVNTFSNSKLSITIPSALIKKCTIKEIENGFVVYSTSNLENGGEVFRVISLTNQEFKKLSKDNNINMEKVDSDKNNTVIIQYPLTNEYSEDFKDEYEEICDAINTIKDNIRLK